MSVECVEIISRLFEKQKKTKKQNLTKSAIELVQNNNNKKTDVKQTNGR